MSVYYLPLHDVWQLMALTFIKADEKSFIPILLNRFLAHDAMLAYAAQCFGRYT